MNGSRLTNVLLGIVATINSAMMLTLVAHLLNSEIHDDQIDKTNMIQNEIGKALKEKVPPPEVTAQLKHHGDELKEIKAHVKALNDAVVRIETKLVEEK